MWDALRHSQIFDFPTRFLCAREGFIYCSHEEDDIDTDAESDDLRIVGSCYDILHDNGVTTKIAYRTRRHLPASDQRCPLR